MTVRRLAVAAWLFVGGATAAAADDALSELLARDHGAAPGLVFAVAVAGETVEEGAVGLASLELGVPLTPDSVLNAGSVAKWFTAYAVLRLAESGQLSLDDEVGTFLDDLPEPARAITVVQLLQHTSGLRDFWALLALAGHHPGDRISQAAAVAMIRRQQHLDFTPGERHLYSNSGYILLAEIVGAVTAERYAEWLRRTVFDPLGMQASRMLDDPFQPVPGLAPSYRRRGDAGEARVTFRREPLNSGVVGSGNLLTSVGDLLRWAHHLETATIAGEPALARMASQPALQGQGPPGYGLGMSLGSHRGHLTVGHGGANAGYRAALLMLPDAGISVAVLANAGHLDTDAIAAVLADRALLRAGRMDVPAAAEAPRVAPSPDPYVGMFLLENGLLLRVRQVSGQLVALITGSSHGLRWVGGHAFALDGDAGRLEYSLDDQGRAQRLTLVLSQARLTGERREPLRLRPRQLRALEGDYLSRELAAVARLVSDGENLRLEQPSGGRITLTPIAPDVFVEWDTADFVVQLERNRGGRLSGFRVSLARARNVLFERL